MKYGAPAHAHPRKAWVDALRALAIFLVVYGHRAGHPDFYLFSSPVKMPLFFALSGYLFNTCGGCDKEFLRRLFWSVVVPWMFLGYLPMAAAFPVKGVAYLWHAFVEVVSGAILWFMPCFIIGKIMFYYLLKWCKDRDVLMFLATAVFFGVGCELVSRHMLDFAKINIAMTVQGYFLFGYLFKKYERTLTHVRPVYQYGALVAFFILGFMSRSLYPNQRMNVDHGAYYHVPLCLTMVVIGLYALFVLSQKVAHYPSWIQTIGMNSLAIYMLDRYAIQPVSMFYDFDHARYPAVLVYALIYFLWSALFAIIISKILNRYIPWATGRRG